MIPVSLCQCRFKSDPFSHRQRQFKIDPQGRKVLGVTAGTG